MIKRILSSFLLLQLGYSGLSWACTCAGGASFDDYRMVFVGEAGRSAVGCDGMHHTEFIVSEPIRGVSTYQSVTVHHTTESPACGVEIAQGEVWLIGTDSGEFSSCHPSILSPTDQNIADVYDALAR